MDGLALCFCHKSVIKMKAVAVIPSEGLAGGGYNFKCVYMVTGRIQFLIEFWTEVSVPSDYWLLLYEPLHRAAHSLAVE